MGTNNSKNNKRLSVILALCLGSTSIIGQILLLRELITVFYGNETAYAIILASWLFWIAVGSLLFTFLVKNKKTPSQLITIFLYLIAILLPLTIFAARSIKQIMHIETGEIIGIIPMCIASFLLLAPLTCVLGGLFPLICHFLEKTKDTTKGLSNIYLFESIGAAVGGCVFSFIFIHFLPALHIAFILSIANISVSLLLNKRKSWIFLLGLSLNTLIAITLLTGLIDKLDTLSRQIQWNGFEIIDSTDSIYGNITLTKRKEEYSFFENGLLSSTTEDELSSEENVHFPLLEHPNPQKVLLIGNGLTGSIAEILKHPVKELDYVEMDAKLIEVAKNYLPEKYLTPLKDNRVSVIPLDARRFIKRTNKKYNVIIVNLSDPTTSLINRYYTLDFFKEAKKTLIPGGILSLSVSSSENYLSDETRAYLQSINTTLKHVFEDVISIPGDTNIFLACNQKNILTHDVNTLIGRLKKRNIDTKFIREYYLPFRLSTDRILYINQALKKEGLLNTDIRPITYLYNIILWSTHFNTTFKNFIQKFKELQPWHLIVLPIPIFLGGWFLSRQRASTPISLSLLTTGFSEIIFQIIVILAFQSLYGYAYYKIGLIMASFMGGLALGSLVAKKTIKLSQAKKLKIYKWSQFGICLYPLLLPIVFFVFQNTDVTQRFIGIFASIFAILPIIAGFIGGLQYPLAVDLKYAFDKKQKEEIVRSAGFLYALDVLGASVGALVTGTILIPLLGINAVAFFCVALNSTVLILLNLMPSYPARSSEVV